MRGWSAIALVGTAVALLVAVPGGASTVPGKATTSGSAGATSRVTASVPATAAPGAAAAAGGRGRPSGHAGGPPLTAAEVKAAQRRLVELGYWPAAAGGPWDATWRQVLIAFQKAEWRKPTGVLTRVEWNEIQRALRPVPRESGPAHIEVDLARQVLFMVDDSGVASRILPVSSGSGKPFHYPGWGRAMAETPCGHFSVFSRGSGWHKSQLGEMYNPLYIVGGIAIHGSLDVPPRPVSHGCIRVPMYAARRLPQLVPREMPVVVYGCKDEGQPPAAVAAER
jgi:lipoprotein-anchoring transpeptidase ErfK/SrfK